MSACVARKSAGSSPTSRSFGLKPGVSIGIGSLWRRSSSAVPAEGIPGGHPSTDATEGGTFYGHLTEDSPTDGGLCLWPNIGWKERFHAVVGTPANVNILTTGTTFDHVLHGREGACDPLDGPTPVLCTTAPAGEGTSEILPGFVGDLYITLEHNVGMFGDTPPDGPYVVEINM